MIKHKIFSTTFFLATSILSIPLSTHAADTKEMMLDGRGIFKTHVLSMNSAIPSGYATLAPFIEKENVSVPYMPSVAPIYTVLNLATATTTTPGADEHIAVDPTNPNNLVAAISDFGIRGGYNTTKFSFSLNNGAPGSWNEFYVPTMGDALITGDGLLWEANSDPVVAMDLAGNVYSSNLYFNGSNRANGLYVASANLHTMGSNFKFSTDQVRPVYVNPNVDSYSFVDKPWIAVDNTNSQYSGNVYVTWTHFYDDLPYYIVFLKSSDQGKTWANPTVVSLYSQYGSLQGSSISIGSNGEIYVAYEVFYVQGFRRHFLAVSTNGGETFSEPKPITPYFQELNFKSNYRKNSFPMLASNPLVPGSLYDVYSDYPSNKAGAQVEFISSTDGGNTFTSPKAINDKSYGQQFFPAVTVDSAGVIHTSWFDTRNSKGNSCYDIYAARSDDGGNSFSVNKKVTRSIIDADRAAYIGDYSGIAAAGGFAHPVWTNGGFHHGHLQTATLK